MYCITNILNEYLHEVSILLDYFMPHLMCANDINYRENNNIL